MIRKPFDKSGIDKLCPHCGNIHGGPDKGTHMESQYDTSRVLEPMRFNRHRVSYETCTDCLSRGKPKVGIE